MAEHESPHIDRWGKRPQFAIIGDPDKMTATVLAADPPIVICLDHCEDSMQYAEACIRRTISWAFGIPPDSFGFFQAGPDLLAQLTVRRSS